MTGSITLKRTLFIGTAMILLLAGCGSQDPEPAAEELAANTQSFGNVAFASGKVVPSQWATLSNETAGRLLWLAEEGTEVAAGDLLAELDATELEQALAQTEAALASAEAQLAQAMMGATQEEIAAADGAVATALGNVAAAEAALSQTEANSGLIVDAATAGLDQAQGVLEVAEADLARARAELARVQAGTRPEELAMYQGLLAQAEAELRIPSNAYDDLLSNDIGGVAEEQARFRVQAAQGARDAAQAQLTLAQAGPMSSDVAAAIAAVQAAEAQVTIAEAGVSAAETALAQAEARLSDVAVAEAQLQIAAGQLEQAEAQRDQLISGATAEEIDMLQAQVDQAEAARAQATAALARARILAPYAGTVGTTHLRIGELLTAGTPVMVFGDLSELRVETTDLNEVDAAQVEVGSSVSLSFDVLPGETIDGTIESISPMALQSQGGGTNFRALITMEEPSELLRWGMTAGVDVELD